MVTSTTLYAAIIAASGALIVAFVNSIIAEVYRRRQDRKALAAGIAGELASYEPALPMLRRILHAMIDAVEGGSRSAISFRPFEKPKDVFFEKAVDKLGLLGPKLVEDTVFVYSNLNAFRTSFALISAQFSEMSDEELKMRCTNCLEALDRAEQRGTCLVVALKSIGGR